MTLKRYTTAELAVFEAKLGIALPRWFSKQLIEVGVRTDRYEFLLEDVINERSLPNLLQDFPWAEAPPKGASIDESFTDIIAARGAFPIADAGCGSLEWVVVRGPLRGSTILTDGDAVIQVAQHDDV